MAESQARDLIYDWNDIDKEPVRYPKRVMLVDETLRDGLQSSSVNHPNTGDKIELIKLMEKLKIDSINLGYPGSAKRFLYETAMLAREITDRNMAIKPQCVARTLGQDVLPIVETVQLAGCDIEACIFIGSSPIRHFVEGWEVADLCKLIKESVGLAVSHGLKVMFILEDTTRARPEHLITMYQTAIDAGASRICLADTAGHATPDGVRAQVRYIRQFLDDHGYDVGMDWHGHRDRGLSTANALTAVKWGVDRVHACALGIGERSGNTAMELLLVNLHMLGLIDQDLTELTHYIDLASRLTGIPIVCNAPVVGRDAFRTATGVHAAAVAKAEETGNEWLSNLVYSSVPASLIGRRQDFEIGPFSGLHNVRNWLKSRGMVLDDDHMRAILDRAKDSSRVLLDSEIQEVVEAMKTKSAV